MSFYRVLARSKFNATSEYVLYILCPADTQNAPISLAWEQETFFVWAVYFSHYRPPDIL